jgi:hypothetical protein
VSRLILALAVLAAGCGYTRVTIPPPVLDGTTEAAEKAFSELQPVSRTIEETYRVQGPGTPGARGLRYDVDTITLGNGLFVEDPRDLIPLVPGSTTAALAKKWGIGRDRWDAHLWTALGTFALGAAGLLTTGAFFDAFGREAGTVYLWTSLAVMALGPLLNVVIPATFTGVIDHLRVEAFQAYEADLRARVTS